MWYCRLSMTTMWMANLCSIFFITSMTFERFYSIIRPHKAASFNTVKRAKKTIISIVILSILYNSPHVVITAQEGRSCVPFGNAIETVGGQVYYWLSLVIHFVLPFVLLLIMNSFIIHTIRLRSNFANTRSEGQGQSKGQSSKIKSSEMQIYIILLLVTFAFLVLMTPSYVLFVYVMFVNYEKSAKSFAIFYILHSSSQKTHYTNYGINFFLYVISGQKFRSDLISLFRCKSEGPGGGSVSNISESSTRLSTIA